jgi:IS605 OrfB family transposase
MKIVKSFSCKISGNDNKILFLKTKLNEIKKLSEFVFELGKDTWFDQKSLYHYCRHYFPELNSKMVQNFISLYMPKKGRKLPKRPIKESIYMDQGQNVQRKETKICTFWLRMFRKNFSLLGKYLEDKIEDPSNIKLVQIYERNSKLYCKLSYVTEKEDISINTNPEKVIGCDTNWYRMVFSNNHFYNTKRLAYRKIEHKKNKKKLKNYTKDFLHKLTKNISLDLQKEGVEVLVLEDLRNLHKSVSKKNGKSKGKLINYIINQFPYGMFQQFLSYKCLDLGIRVEKTNPTYTSKMCSHCGSKDTQRPTQSSFVCNICGTHLNADLNGSRNVKAFYMNSLGVHSESCPSQDL